MTWVKGQSGNPTGRKPQGNTLTEQLQRLMEELDDGTGKSNMRLLAEATLKLALLGNAQAQIAIYDRLGGKPAQAITLRGDDAAPLHVLHTDRLVGWEAPGSLHEGEEAPQLPAPSLKAPEQDSATAEAQGGTDEAPG